MLNLTIFKEDSIMTTGNNRQTRSFVRTRLKRKRWVFVAVCVIAILAAAAFTLSACSANSMGIASVQDWVNVMRGNLIGNDYNIQEFDDYGSLVFTAHGDAVNIKTTEDTGGNQSSYLEIIIDGKEWDHVGSTLVFAQNGVDMITDFTIPENMGSGGNSTGFKPAERYINKYRYFIGKKMVVLV